MYHSRLTESFESTGHLLYSIIADSHEAAPMCSREGGAQGVPGAFGVPQGPTANRDASGYTALPGDFSLPNFYLLLCPHQGIVMTSHGNTRSTTSRTAQSQGSSSASAEHGQGITGRQTIYWQ